MALGAVQTFCQASGSKVNKAKLQENSAWRERLQGHRRVPRETSIRHLGIRLSTNPAKAAEETHKDIIGVVERVINYWISKPLTQIGRSTLQSRSWLPNRHT